MWVASWDKVDELERPMHYHGKAKVTRFFNGIGEYLLNSLPQNQSMDAKHFAAEIVSGLEDVCYPEGRNPHKRKMTLPFTNAPIHNTRTVM
jgi:hypothetical protein